MEVEHLKTLVIARHGSYDFQSKVLTPVGEQQIEKLRESLEQVLIGGSTLILFSPTPRTRRTAEILAKDTLPMEETQELYSETSSHYKPDKALAKLQEKLEAAETIVLVTHFEYAEAFPRFVGQRLLEMSIPQEEMAKGQAILIDCEAKTYSYLPS